MKTSLGPKGMDKMLVSADGDVRLPFRSLALYYRLHFSPIHFYNFYNQFKREGDRDERWRDYPG